jgi:hypothetical protein
MQTRRSALVTIASAAAVPLLGQHVHIVSDLPAAQPHAPIYFKGDDYSLISRLADLIIPRTDTPGALDANVPYRIDHEVAGNEKLQQILNAGLAGLRDKDFLTLPDPKQVEVLTALSDAPKGTPDADFFQNIKDLTVDWYYRTEEGLVQELHFQGNTFRPNFPGCTHPEHWPAAAQTTETSLPENK